MIEPDKRRPRHTDLHNTTTRHRRLRNAHTLKQIEERIRAQLIEGTSVSSGAPRTRECVDALERGCGSCGGQTQPEQAGRRLAIGHHRNPALFHAPFGAPCSAVRIGTQHRPPEPVSKLCGGPLMRAIRVIERDREGDVIVD
ncbi:MAG TPA: hypothetical protein VH442_08280, partial [Micromonosporaceae bacterium]